MHGHGAWATGCSTALVLGGGGRDAHGSVSTVDALHLGESALLLTLIGEANEAIATGETADWIGHNLGRLARWELALEKRVEDIFVDLGSQVADEDRELRSTLITAAIGETSTGGPIELEWAIGVIYGLSVQLQSFSSSG